MSTDFNSLARTLAERAADDLWNDLSDFQREITERERDAEYAAFIAAAIEPVEAVIREAIDKTRQQTLEDLASDLNGSRRTVEVMPAVDKRYSDGLWEGLTIAIEWVDKHARRSLKQSNSGMEVKK